MSTNPHPLPEPPVETVGGEKVWRAGTLTYTTAGLAVLFFWLLWGDFAWQLKERSVPSVIQLLFKRFEASDALTGLLIGSLPQALGLILGPIIAYKSDRHRGPWGRRIPFLLIPTPFIVLAMVGLAYCPVLGQSLHNGLGAHSPGLNLSILLLLGLFWTLFEFASTIANSVVGALINDVVPQAVIGRFFGFFRALSLIAGIVFNHWLVGKAETHYVWIFLGMGALYGVGLGLMVLKVKEGTYPAPLPLGPQRGVAGFFVAAKSYFRERFCIPYYWWYYVFNALSWMGMMPIALYGLFFAKSLHVELATYGNCIALTYTISLVLAYPLGALADRVHPLRLGLVFQSLYVLVTLWGGIFARDTTTFAIALVSSGAVAGAWMTATASIAQRLLPKEEFAQFGSAAGLVSAVCGITAAPAVGFFLDHVNHVYRYTYFITSGIEMMALFCCYVLYRKFMALGGPVNYVAPQ